MEGEKRTNSTHSVPGKYDNCGFLVEINSVGHWEITNKWLQVGQGRSREPWVPSMNPKWVLHFLTF